MSFLKKIPSAVLSGSGFKKLKFGNYQALNSPSTPFSKLSENDVEEYFVKLSEEILEILL